jgi:hypothetical protein
MKLQGIAQAADKDFMDVKRFRITNRFSRQSLQTCPKGEMLAFDFLRISLACMQDIPGDNLMVCEIVIRVNMRDIKIQIRQ